MPFLDQPAPNRICNYRLSRARRVIEKCIWHYCSKKFRVLQTPFLLTPDRVQNIALTICVLHNYLLASEESRANYSSPGLIDSEQHPLTYCIPPDNWRAESTPSSTLLPLLDGTRHNYTSSQKDVKDEFREYFMTSAGEVTWQYVHIA